MTPAGCTPDSRAISDLQASTLHVTGAPDAQQVTAPVTAFVTLQSECRARRLAVYLRIVPSASSERGPVHANATCSKTASWPPLPTAAELSPRQEHACNQAENSACKILTVQTVD